MSASLRNAMQLLGEQMEPVLLPGNTWRRARRFRYGARLIGAAAALVVVGAGVALVGGVSGGSPAAQGDTAVPASVRLPYVWQATVEMAPPGAVSVLFGGDGWGLTSDLFEDGGKLAAVGENGAYRVLRFPSDGVRAGLDARLSPDGNQVAEAGHGAGEGGWLRVTDLRTGTHRDYGAGDMCCGEPVAWRPDGGAVLVLHRSDRLGVPQVHRTPSAPAQYTVIDLNSGIAVPVGEVVNRDDLRSVWAAAFAPDGQRLAVTVPTATGTALQGYDVGGRQLWTRELGDRRHLAGAGAYTPDGHAIAIVTVTGCIEVCDSKQLAERTWSVSYVDAATGSDVGGPSLPEVRGQAVRALGWRGADLIVVLSEPEDGAQRTDDYFDDAGWAVTGHVRVLALRSGTGPVVLLDPPDEVTSIDIPADAVLAGRFGTEVPSPSVLPARWSVVAQWSLCTVVPVLVLAVAVIAIIRRARRRRPVV